MRFGRWSGLVGALALACATVHSAPARAGDFGAPLGLYAGGFATWLVSGFDLNVNPVDLKLPNSATASGFGGGFMVGYDWAPFFDNWTVGVVADASLGDWSQSFGTGNGYTTSVDFLVTMRARVGYWVHPQFMPYFTTGIAWQGMTFKSPAFVTSTGNLGVSEFSNTLTGWTIGGGLDWQLGHSITFNAEYLFSDFGDWSFTRSSGQYTVPVSSNQVRLGLKIPLSDPEYIETRRRY